MDNTLISILLYPYAYQYVALFISLLIFLTFAIPAYGLYRLIIWKMNVRVKTKFHRLLIVAGVFLVVLFYTGIALSSITKYHVNKQMGFRYATPETPEGEPFLITKVSPGKIMDKSGLKPGDHVQMYAVSHLYTLLINNQGKEVEIPIKRDSIKMKIKVKVPELDVPLAGVSFLF